MKDIKMISNTEPKGMTIEENNSLDTEYHCSSNKDKLLTVEEIEEKVRSCDDFMKHTTDVHEGNCDDLAEAQFFSEHISEEILPYAKKIKELEEAMLVAKKQRDKLECYMIAEGYDFKFIQSVKSETPPKESE